MVPYQTQPLGFTPPAPFGLDNDVLQLILSVPVTLYSVQVFLAGHCARCRPPLNMRIFGASPVRFCMVISP